ncbi:phage coat protein [Yersinia enterocolitica]|nr:phage coat protein [Yersinia enterocolitica]
MNILKPITATVVRSKNTLVNTALLLSIGVASFCATAADTDPAAQAFETLKTQAGTFITDAWALAVVIVSATVGIKLFKKFVNRAS